MRLNDKIRLIRKVKDYSQEYMAYRLNISQSTYSRYENGKIRLRMEEVDRILEVLEIEMDEFIAFDIKFFINRKNSIVEEEIYPYFKTIYSDF